LSTAFSKMVFVVTDFSPSNIRARDPKSALSAEVIFIKRDIGLAADFVDLFLRHFGA
jgi:hypothetical protein